MITLSIRRNADSTFRFGDPTWGQADGPALTATQVYARLLGRRVLALIHGYNVCDALDAYARIDVHIGEHYDEVVGILWPGSRINLGFGFAWDRAPKAGSLIAQALGGMPYMSLDVEGHSLGCRVALETLQSGLSIRNIILSAAAVDNEVVHRMGLYGDALTRTHRCLVAHSRNDEVLRFAYAAARWDSALGLDGPENPALTAPNVVSFDCSADVHAHGDYKRSFAFFSAWKSILAPDTPFPTGSK